MMTSSPTNPQAIPPLHAVDGDDGTSLSASENSRPLYSLSLPPADDDDGITTTAPSLILPPAAVISNSNHTSRLSSPGHSSSIGLASSPTSEQSESLTNFMKYGSIRPPVSVLQDEFLDKYRLWKDHAEPLDGMEGAGKAGGDAWTGFMAGIQTMHAKHHNGPQLLDQPQSLFEPRSSGLLVENTKNECKDEEKPTSSDEDGEHADCCVDGTSDTNPAVTSSDDDLERRQLESLADLMFRPGSKLSGTIDIQPESTRSDYELIVMEGDVLDELGRPRGILARHKFAGDQQCVFVKVSFVPLPKVAATDKEEERKSVDEDGGASSEDDASDKDGSNTASEEKTEPKLTIQINYSDGEKFVHGLWNHNSLCFQGTVKKQTEGDVNSNQMGGTIISGLISGHSSFGNGSSASNDGSNPHDGSNGRMNPTPPSSPSAGKRTFSLSPCSHLHPRGIAPAPLCLSALTNTFSRLGLFGIQVEGTRADGETGADLFLAACKKKNVNSPEKRRSLIEEVSSHDNYKLVLHRARTQSLRLETLKKLVQLGQIIDFAELARKRNLAKRREKRRAHVRKYAPRVPRRLKRGKRTAMTSGEDYDISKDDVQKKKLQFYDQLAGISWGDLLEEASIQAERTCAAFRRQTSLLENLTFESDEYKAQLMADLRVNGLALAASHSDWDQCIQMGRTVALGWSWFERGSWSCFERSAVVGKQCVYLLFQMHSRLEANHKHLEKSFRGADARLTNVQLERIKSGTCYVVGCKKKNEEDEADGLCGICQCDMNDEEEGEGNANEDNPAVCLPCSHSFHWECIRVWLHNHSQCPICRVELNTV